MLAAGHGRVPGQHEEGRPRQHEPCSRIGLHGDEGRQQALESGQVEQPAQQHGTAHQYGEAGNAHGQVPSPAVWPWLRSGRAAVLEARRSDHVQVEVRLAEVEQKPQQRRDRQEPQPQEAQDDPAPVPGFRQDLPGVHLGDHEPRRARHRLEVRQHLDAAIVLAQEFAGPAQHRFS